MQNNRQTFDDRLEELAVEIKQIMFLKLSGEADVVLSDATRYKYLDVNNRGTSKVLTDAVLSGVSNTVAPLVLNQTQSYKVENSTNTVSTLHTGFSKYRFYIDDVEVYTTGELVSYRGEYDTLGIIYSTEVADLVEMTAKDFLHKDGEIFESWKSGGVPIGAVSKYTLTTSQNSCNAVYFVRKEYDRKNSEARYYFTSEEIIECLK